MDGIGCERDRFIKIPPWWRARQGGGIACGSSATGRRSSNDMLWQHSQNTFCMAQPSAGFRPHGNLLTGLFTHAAVNFEMY